MFSYRIITLIFSFLWLTIMVNGQEILTPIRDFCKPGVLHKSPSKGLSIEYGLFPGYELSSSSSDKKERVEANHHLLAKVKIPLVNKKKMKVLLGLRYFEEVYQFNSDPEENEWMYVNLNGKVMKSTRLSAYFTRSIGYKYYMGLKAEWSSNGDFNRLSHLGKRYQEANLVGMFGVKKSEYKEWGLGVIARNGYRGVAVYPFVLYNHTFNEKWGLESILPVKLMLRYRLHARSLFLFGGEMASRNYSIDMLQGNMGPHGRYQVRFPEAQLNVSYQQQLSNWIWMEMKTGFVHYMDSSVRGTRSVADAAFQVKKGNGAFMKLGLFLSPPSHYYK